MKQPHWDRVQEIYHAALALPPFERSAFVASACADDADLLHEIISLLKAADSSSGPLNSPVFTFGSAADNLVGMTISERYFVERELGRSAMSQVYFARALTLQHQAVVLKVLARELLQDSDAQQRFEKEVEALLRIDHIGVVRVIDSGKLTDGRPYIVMPYVDGETLRSEIRSEGMDLERAASILKEIGDALDHVHEKRIFHRDLKPENIILKSGTDSVVLIDFGIARVQDSLIASTTAHNKSAGTLRYMSPEHLRGKQITAASDIYSLGIVAYEMITGRRPFNPASVSHQLELQRRGVRVKPSDLRDGLSTMADRVITRALKFEPRARYQRASEFTEKLNGALLATHKPPHRIPTWAKVIGCLIVLAVLSWAVYRYLDAGDIRPRRSFTYWLTVQKMHEGKEYQEPFKSNGEEIFGREDKFQLSVSSPEPGFLYVFNEGPPPEPSDTSFTMLRPSTAANNGSATLGANQTVQFDWITFRGPPGSENFWIVWSVSPVPQLESAKTAAFRHPRGGLTGENLEAVKEFLRMKELETDVTVWHYKARQEADARGKGDLLVTLAEFKHR